MKYLVTGAAGFIGFHVALKLAKIGHEVVGLDNLNDYYEVSLKKSRLEVLSEYSNFSFEKIDLADRLAISNLFSKNVFERVIHLGAQAGVRYSLENPMAYIDSNLIGYINILEGCRHNKVKHLLYASSSSVYGLNKKIPFSIEDRVDHPVSLYAATKKSNELMSHTYSHLYGLPTTGLRFFTVYGPWGRPDMALYKFTKSIIAGLPIDVYNNGDMLRDFTFVDDIVESIFRLQSLIPKACTQWSVETGSAGLSNAPYAVYNLGNSNPIKLSEYIDELEIALNKKAIRKLLPLQMGDVINTYADTSELVKAIDFKPNTPVADGIKKFVSWYKEYYK
jgi:UDP-glucuronate 4-epimerase